MVKLMSSEELIELSNKINNDTIKYQEKFIRLINKKSMDNSKDKLVTEILRKIIIGNKQIRYFVINDIVLTNNGFKMKCRCPGNKRCKCGNKVYCICPPKHNCKCDLSDERLNKMIKEYKEQIIKAIDNKEYYLKDLDFVIDKITDRTLRTVYNMDIKLDIYQTVVCCIDEESVMKLYKKHLIEFFR